MSTIIKILSIDGGGIRGIIPAMILAEIEKRTQKRIAELFHMLAGTSTGGILALGLTKPDATGKPQYTASELIDLYETEGTQIFSRSTWHKIYSVGNLAEEKYPAAGIEAVLDKYFGAARLKEAITEVLIPSYEIEQRIPFFFKRWKARNDPQNDFPMQQVARATSAAPTYFEPARIAIDAPLDYFALIDGGVYINNPALSAFVEAKKLHENAGDFLVVSLGTGELTRGLLYEKVKGWGLIRWAQPMLSVIFDGVSKTVDYEMSQLLSPKDGIERYYRFQVILYEGNENLDDASATNTRILKLLAESMIHDNDDKLSMLCEQLVQ